MKTTKVAIVGTKEDDDDGKQFGNVRGGSFRTLKITGNVKDDDERIGNEQVCSPSVASLNTHLLKHTLCSPDPNLRPFSSSTPRITTMAGWHAVGFCG